ncbi:universal stress protein [Halostella sp. JP-L12]|uniref:universal stress protein n=1 Tax=Halostella TaxID=1843185 RepID=UPI000EF84027|nr:MULTISPECIES: universal stress protein [Halostella]NHN47140.1 universal stress protein [Halostella sp. JP-L12]
MENARTVVRDDAGSAGYTLVVAVSNPDNVEQLMRTAVDVAGSNDGEIRVVSVIHKPATSPFLLFAEEDIKREYADGQGAVADRAVAAADESSVPVRRSVVVGSDVADAILLTVEEADADALLIGWQDRPRPVDIVLGTTVDPVIRRAPCDVFVERVGTTADGIDRVLLPTDGGPHVDLAADVVDAVAVANDAAVTVVSYAGSGAPEADFRTAREHVERASDRLSVDEVEASVRETTDPANAIVSLAAEHDLVALGATPEGVVRDRVVGSVAETVGGRAAPPIVIAKRDTGRSFVERTLGRLR